MSKAKVIPFTRKNSSKSKLKNQPASIFAKTNSSIFEEVQEDILGAWRMAAVKDGINDFIHDELPSGARQYDDDLEVADYVNDLNILARIEQKLKMKLAIFWPGCTPTNPVGWLAAFHREKEVFTTPPDMASEGYARAMNIVLCVVFEKTLKTLGRN